MLIFLTFLIGEDETFFEQLPRITTNIISNYSLTYSAPLTIPVKTTTEISSCILMNQIRFPWRVKNSNKIFLYQKNHTLDESPDTEIQKIYQDNICESRLAATSIHPQRITFRHTKWGHSLQELMINQESKTLLSSEHI